MTKATDNEAFVREFQARTGLKADGWAGSATRGKLDALLPPRVDAGGLKVSQAGIDLIHSFEACKLTAYPDPGSSDGNPWTIGWGSTGPDIRKGTVWTQRQADDRFAADIAKFSQGVADAVAGGTPTNQAQFDALVSFAYNVGLGALKGSTLLELHRQGQYSAAQAQFARWNRNDGEVMKGLARRRAAEAAMYGGA